MDPADEAICVSRMFHQGGGGGGLALVSIFSHQLHIQFYRDKTGSFGFSMGVCNSIPKKTQYKAKSGPSSACQRNTT